MTWLLVWLGVLADPVVVQCEKHQPKYALTECRESSWWRAELMYHPRRALHLPACPAAQCWTDARGVITKIGSEEQ